MEAKESVAFKTRVAEEIEREIYDRHPKRSKELKLVLYADMEPVRGLNIARTRTRKVMKRSFIEPIEKK